jgi:ribosome-binding factor A
VAEELHLKHTPTLEFVFDESVQRGMRISKLIDEQSEAEGE